METNLIIGAAFQKFKTAVFPDAKGEELANIRKAFVSGMVDGVLALASCAAQGNEKRVDSLMAECDAEAQQYFQRAISGVRN